VNDFFNGCTPDILVHFCTVVVVAEGTLLLT
jgi:hypothetical protein